MNAIVDIMLEFAKDHLFLHVLLILLTTIVLVVSMTIDLVAGIHKAKMRGIARTSTGYKKTCDKARKYFSPYLELICIDILCCIIVPVPAFSMLWAAWCVFCEFKSVREKSWEKAELRKMEKTMSVIIENKDDIAKILAEIVTSKENQKSEDNGRL